MHVKQHQRYVCRYKCVNSINSKGKIRLSSFARSLVMYISIQICCCCYLVSGCPQHICFIKIQTLECHIISVHTSLSNAN